MYCNCLDIWRDLLLGINLWTILHLHNCICGERYITPGPDRVKKTPEKLALKKDIVFLSVLMLQAILVKKYAIVEI